jgi:hypothetical protein
MEQEEQEFELLFDEHLSTPWTKDEILDKVRKLVEKDPTIDGIILHSMQTKKGVRLENEDYPLFVNGNHPYVGAAYTRKGYTLEDMKRKDLRVVSMQPSLYFNPNHPAKGYHKVETLVPTLSLFWFILTLILTFITVWFLIKYYPRDRYYHVVNKRIVVI